MFKVFALNLCLVFGFDVMSVWRRVGVFLQLFRIQTAVATASAPLLGGMVMGLRDGVLLFLLFVVGLLLHVYGFVLNEIFDVEVDRKSGDLQGKPLVSGDISVRQAYGVVVVSVVVLCVVMGVVFSSVVSFVLLVISLVLAGVYDVFGKRLVGADFVLAGSFFFICLCGSSTVSLEFSLVAILLGLIFFIQIVFNNAVEGGLKDVDHDFLAGAKTLALRLGVVVDKGVLRVSKRFWLFSLCVKGVFVVLVLWLGVQPGLQVLFGEGFLVFVIAFLLLLGSVFFMVRFLRLGVFDRSRLKRLFSGHEMSAYAALLLMLYPVIGLEWSVFLIVLPLVWFLVFNMGLYGTLLEPRV